MCQISTSCYIQVQCKELLIHTRHHMVMKKWQFFFFIYSINLLTWPPFIRVWDSITVQCCNEVEMCLTWNKNKNNWRIWKNIKGKDLKDKNILTYQFNGYLYLLQLSYTVLFVGEGRRFSTKRTSNVCLSFKLRQTLANTMS